MKKKRGRPPGSKNKPKEKRGPGRPKKETVKKRGRPVGAKDSTPRVTKEDAVELLVLREWERQDGKKRIVLRVMRYNEIAEPLIEKAVFTRKKIDGNWVFKHLVGFNTFDFARLLQQANTIRNIMLTGKADLSKPENQGAAE